MKRSIAVTIIAVIMVIGNAYAAVVIDNSWTNGITFVEQDANSRNVYSIDDPSAVPMYKTVKGHTKYMATPVEVIDDSLHMGSCAYDIAQAHHSVSLEYAWDADLTNVGIQFTYVGRSNDFTYITVTVGYRQDMNATGGTEYVYEVLRTKESGTYTITAADIATIIGNKQYNVVYIQESDIGISNEGTFDDIIITADNVPSLAPPFVVIQKPGLYTAELVTGENTSSDIYVNGVLTNTFYERKAYIGVLDEGDEVRIVTNNKEAESIEEIDWQSWNFLYDNESIQIYVEDPPAPECVPEVVEVEVPRECPVVEPTVCPEPEPVTCEPETIEIPVEISTYEGLNLECLDTDSRRVCNWKRQARRFIDKVTNAQQSLESKDNGKSKK